MNACKTLPLLLFISVFLSCESAQEDGQQIILTNTSAIDLQAKPIAIDRSALEAEGEAFPLIVAANGDTIPSQLDDTDADGQWDELFFVVDLNAGDSAVLSLDWTGTQPAYEARTSVRFGKRDGKDLPVEPRTSDTIYAGQIHARLGYQPYQTDGPSFENDKVGFRHYFDGRNAKDLFGKKTSAMSPETVGISANGGVEDNYHEMADWGRDVLAVGNSVGIGGVALMIGDGFARLGNIANDTVTNFDHAVFTIIKEGPVRSIMDFSYYGWQPLEGRNYTLEERVRIWPGTYAFHGAAQMQGLQGDETLLVGLVNLNTDEALTELRANEKYVVLYTHDQQTYDKTWWLGLAIILPSEAYLGHGEAPETGRLTSSYFAKMKLENNTPVEYYGLGAWEMAVGENFSDSTYFVNHLQNFADQLAAEVRVDVR